MARHTHIHIHDAGPPSSYGPGQNPASHQPHPMGPKPLTEMTKGGMAGHHSNEAHHALNAAGFRHSGKVEPKLTHRTYYTAPDHPNGQRSVSIVPHGGAHEGFFWNSYRGPGGGRHVQSGEGNKSLMSHLSRVKK